MAVNPIQFLVAQNASITDGTKTITISGNVDCSRVYSGTAIFLGGADNPAEAVSGTSPDGSGNSTITLRNNWSQGDIVNQQLVSFNTNEGLAEAISNVREIVSNVSAIEDLATQGLIKRINDNEYEVVSISALGEALVGASDASSARTALGLGSAATRDVTTSRVDTDINRVMRVSDFGLGDKAATPYPSDNFDDATVPCGFYRLINGNPSSGTRPEGFNAFAYCQVQSYDVNSKLQTVVDVSGKKAYRTFSSSNTGTWIYDYNSGNSVNPKDYGIGTSIVPNITDYNTLSYNGIYSAPNGTTNAPIGGNYAVLRASATNANNGFELAGHASPDQGQTRLYYRGEGGTTYQPWVELYHSGNTNFNEFGGIDIDHVVAQGAALNNNYVLFYLPINSHIPPTGITVEGTFKVRTLFNNAMVKANVTPTLFGISSNKVACIGFNTLGATGLSQGDALELVTESSTSKITVNF